MGVMYGALSRLCYAKQWGYHSILYTDRDLTESILPTQQKRHGVYESNNQYYRMWSKCFLTLHTFTKFNLSADDWVFWLDSDTAITNPSISVETIVKTASTRRIRDPSSATGFRLNYTIPELLIANTYNGINNGVMAMRATEWSKRWLRDWWDDQNSNTHAGDNGPFMHSVLRAMALNNGIEYKNECHMKTNAQYATFGPMERCFREYMYKVICKGDKTNCVSRCPHDQKPLGSEWEPKAVWRTDYELGFMIENDPRIGGHCRINNGFGWTPVALWMEDRWNLHMAGRHTEDRNRTMQDYVKRYGSRFSPRCF